MSLFRGMAEYTFQTQLGVADPPLLDYVSHLLTRFVRSDEIYPIRNLSGKPLRGVAEMLAEAQERVGFARREVHRHIGDYTLFWTGIYPEAIHRLQADPGRINWSTTARREKEPIGSPARSRRRSDTRPPPRTSGTAESTV